MSPAQHASSQVNVHIHITRRPVSCGTPGQHAERIIELRRGRARSHAFGLLGLAQIIALQPQPDLEHACAVAGQALDATQSLSSYLVVDQLQTLERLVQPYEPNEFVKDFRERLRVHLEEHIGFYEWMTGSTTTSSPEPS